MPIGTLKTVPTVLAEDLVNYVAKMEDKCPIRVRDEFMRQSLYPDAKILCFSMRHKREGWLRESLRKVLVLNLIQRIYIVEDV